MSDTGDPRVRTLDIRATECLHHRCESEDVSRVAVILDFFVREAARGEVLTSERFARNSQQRVRLGTGLAQTEEEWTVGAELRNLADEVIVTLVVDVQRADGHDDLPIGREVECLPKCVLLVGRQWRRAGAEVEAMGDVRRPTGGLAA